MRIALFSLTAAFSLTVLGAACATDKNACATDKNACPTPPRDGTGVASPCGKDGPGRHGAGKGGPGMHAGMHGGGGGGAGCPMDGGASSTALPSGVNAVQNEMRLLNHAFHKSMTAAALGDVSVIPPLFHEVHLARGLTDQAVAGGSWKPAKGELAEFQAMDKAFHDELEKLVHAAVANDRTAVVAQLNTLLPSCVACHSAHREPGMPAGMNAAQPAPAEHPAHTKP